MFPTVFLLLLSSPPELPVAPPPRPALPPGVDPLLADWSPRPATGKAEPWEKATDKDWVDPRFRLMDTGPFFNCTMRYPLGKGNETVYKATVVKLSAKGDASVVFDRCTMRLGAAWTGGFLNHSDRRFGLMNTPTPKGEMVFGLPKGAGWADFEGDWLVKAEQVTKPLPRWWMQYQGLYLNGDQTVFRYKIGETEVLDAIGLEQGNGYPVFTRTVEVQKTETEIVGLLIGVTGTSIIGTSSPEKKRFYQWTDAVKDGKRLAWAFLPVGKNTWSQSQNGQHRVMFRPSNQPGRVKFVVAAIPEDGVKEFAKFVDATAAPEEVAPLTKGSPKRWGEPIITKLERGKDQGAFAVDTLTIPYKNRFNALFFCTGLDFLKDGRVAVCTCHGDVWVVTVDEKAGTCSWQRFATGLYQPLGLKVIDGKIVVLERGQLTRLHDFNHDGEADFYECINNDWHTGGGEHA